MICKRPNGICQCSFIFSGGRGINGAHTHREIDDDGRRFKLRYPHHMFGDIGKNGFGTFLMN